MSDAITIVLNGEPLPVPSGTNVVGLLANLGIDPQRIAVERNRVVVRRARHAETTLQDGDEIEIVTFVGGG